MFRGEPATGRDGWPASQSIEGEAPRSKPFTVNLCVSAARSTAERACGVQIPKRESGGSGGDRSRKPHDFTTPSWTPPLLTAEWRAPEIAEETVQKSQDYRTIPYHQHRNEPARRCSRACYSAGSAVFEPRLRLASELLQNSRFSAKGETLFEKFSAGRIRSTLPSARPAGFVASRPAYLPGAASPAPCSNPVRVEYLPGPRVPRRRRDPVCPAAPAR